MHTNDKLRVEIDRELDAIKNMEVGSEEHSAAVDHVTKLYDRLIETERLEGEGYDKAETRKEDRKNRLIGYIISGLSIGLPAVINIWAFKKSMKFEEVGTITSQAGREMFKRLFSKK
jgi:hypothetical protein